MATLSVTADEAETTIRLDGDMVSVDAALVDAFDEAFAEIEAPCIVLDITGVTALGIAGAGLLFGAYRGAAWGVEVVCRAGVWTPAIQLVSRGVLPVV